MAGYWNRPDETAQVMTPDGFFRSGDMGFMDERGFIKIVDRMKDMILVSGFNVYPNEVEDVPPRIPACWKRRPIGVPDEHSGEAVKLFVVTQGSGAHRGRCQGASAPSSLTNYKRPRISSSSATSLPKTNVGKILRKEWRA